MTYVVNESCIRCKTLDCVEVCPVDCFYEGENMLVIHPDECIDCSVCVPECPVDAIQPDTDPGLEEWLSLNAEYAKIWPKITVKKAVASRHAKIGDKLVTTKFNNSLTGGFAGVQELTIAVCLLSGTEVAFEREVECENVFNRKLIRQKVARFRQINLEQPNVHHDALEFPDGQVVKLTQLCEGQHATVLQLPASPRATNEAEQQKRGSLVT